MDIQNQNNQTETDWKGQYIRALADYDNLKKHTVRAADIAATKTRNEMLTQLLPIYWDFHRAKVNGWVKEEGIALLISNLENFFINKYNLTIIGDDVVDKQFDADTMSAVSTAPAETTDKHNRVQSVILPGLIDGENNVISHAIVCVYK